MAFFGEYRHTLDAKGRLTLPARMRDEIAGEEVVLTRWMEPCIAVWSPDSFADMAAKVRALPVSDNDARVFGRNFFASVEHERVDKQGRITIPAPLRQRAGIDGPAVIVGNDTHLEIWNPQNWDRQNEALNDDAFAETAGRLNF